MSELPVFRVVRGTPTPEELAALVGVVWSRRAAAAVAPVPAGSRWRASALPRAGRLPRPAPGAWSATH